LGKVNHERINALYKQNYKKILDKLIRNRLYEETMSWPKQNKEKQKEYKLKKNRLAKQFVNEYIGGV
jgi:hypothetical protein